MRRRSKQRPQPWAVALGGILAAAGGLALTRRAGARSAWEKAVAALPAKVRPGASGGETSRGAATNGSGAQRSAEASDGASARQPWQCECGQAYLVAGQDRHQIYWLEGADESDPVLSDTCPNCDRPLPAISRVNAAD
jgi:hypothetical protein